jgi:hypothetical protein
MMGPICIPDLGVSTAFDSGSRACYTTSGAWHVAFDIVLLSYTAVYHPRGRVNGCLRLAPAPCPLTQETVRLTAD